MEDDIIDVKAEEAELDKILGLGGDDDSETGGEAPEAEAEEQTNEPENTDDAGDDEGFSFDNEREDTEQTPESGGEPGKEPDDGKSDSHMLKSLREEGKKRKEFERENVTLAENNAKLQAEVDELREKLERREAQGSPLQHPEFVKLRSKALKELFDDIYLNVGSSEAKALQNSFSNEWESVCQMMEKDSPEERDEIRNKTRLSLAKKLRLVDEDAVSLEEDDDATHRADEIIRVMARHKGSYRELVELFDSVQAKGKNKSLEIGYKDYMEKTATVRKNLMAVASMTEAEIAEDPDSIQGIVAARIHSSPEARKEYHSIVKSMMEAMFGPEALSQEALDRYSQSGRDMNEFHAARLARAKAFQEKEIPRLAMLAMLYHDTKKALPAWLKTQREEAEEKNRRAALRSATPAGKAPGKKTGSYEEDLSEMDRIFG